MQPLTQHTSTPQAAPASSASTSASSSSQQQSSPASSPSPTPSPLESRRASLDAETAAALAGPSRWRENQQQRLGAPSFDLTPPIEDDVEELSEEALNGTNDSRRSSVATTDLHSVDSSSRFDQQSVMSAYDDDDDDFDGPSTPPSTAPSLFSGEGDHFSRRGSSFAKGKNAAQRLAMTSGVTPASKVQGAVEVEDEEETEEVEGSEDEHGIDLPAALLHAQAILQAEAKALLDAAQRLGAAQASAAAKAKAAKPSKPAGNTDKVSTPTLENGGASSSSSSSATSDGFAKAIRLIVGTIAGGGKIVWTGVGKSGLIARKLNATTLSLGLPSAYLHPTEALHGDLGVLSGRFPYSPRAPLLRARASEHRAPPAPVPDIVIALSHSGGSAEVVSLLPHILARDCKIVAFSAKRSSKLVSTAEANGGAWVDCTTSSPPQLLNGVVGSGAAASSSTAEGAEHCSCCLSSKASRSPRSSSPTGHSGEHDCTAEADPLVPAPTSSTTVALAMGDALVLSVARACGLGRQSFAACHPGGSLGAQLGGEEGIRVAIGVR